MICPLQKLAGGNESLEGGLWANVFRCRNGADDETTRCAVEGDGQEDQLGDGRDHRGDAAHDAALEGAAGGAWIQRPGGPAKRKGEFPARAAEDGRTGAGVVSGEVLRPERAAFPRETGRSARNPVELHVDLSGAGGGR